MSEAPWIMFHAVWTSRQRDGLKLLAQVQRFLSTCAFDLRTRSASLEVFEDHGDAFAHATRDVPSTGENLARALEASAYRPGPLVEAVRARLGEGKHGTWASGAGGFATRWQWERYAWRDDEPIDAAPLLDAYRAHAAQPPVARAPGGKAIELRLGYEFEIKRPDATEPLFPETELRSALSIGVASRHASLAVRYGIAEPTPAFTDAHQAIVAALVAALGTKPPPSALQRIIPAKRPGGRERSERL